jgi:hypothetical protein
MPMTIKIVDEGLRSPAGLRDEASTPRAFKRTARRGGKPKKMGGGENP